MYYDRTLKDEFAQLLNEGKELRWLFDFVKEKEDLDFLTGKNLTNKTGWISVYRGLSRILTVTQYQNNDLKFDAANAYKVMMPELYGRKYLTSIFTDEKKQLNILLEKVRKHKDFDRYYNNKKEGYYQNILSRDYALNATNDSEFIIIDKEAIIGYENQDEKDILFTPMQDKFKKLQKLLSSTDERKFGKNLDKKALGGELDFIAIDREGNILLIEYKDGTNTSGIYLSPIQIGFYTELFKEFEGNLEESLLSMLKQKQEMGLISKEFKVPSKLKDIIPVLMISNYKSNSVSKEKFQDVMTIIRTKSDFGENYLQNLKIVNFIQNEPLETLNW